MINLRELICDMYARGLTDAAVRGFVNRSRWRRIQMAVRKEVLHQR
jgi:hypothetical protein